MIVRDQRYFDTLWCKCRDYDEYLEFAKDLYEFTGRDIRLISSGERDDEPWFGKNNIGKWAELFGVEKIETEGKLAKYPDPAYGEYEITEKPEDNEYPVVVMYDGQDSCLYWVSLNKFESGTKKPYGYHWN